MTLLLSHTSNIFRSWFCAHENSETATPAYFQITGTSDNETLNEINVTAPIAPTNDTFISQVVDLSPYTPLSLFKFQVSEQMQLEMLFEVTPSMDVATSW